MLKDSLQLKVAVALTAVSFPASPRGRDLAVGQGGQGRGRGMKVDPSGYEERYFPFHPTNYHFKTLTLPDALS